MNPLNVMARSLGARYKEGRVRLAVWAPHAKSVLVQCYRSGATGTPIPLQPQEKGYWTGELEAPAGMRYTFVADGRELPDPASLSQPDGVHGRSEVFDPGAFRWSDHRWKNPPLDDYLFYELHTGTFTPEGTFAAIEDKLDHLVALGITAIEIMPVAQFPGGRNWGYDGVFPYAVQQSYGGPGGLQHLVDKCHEKGLAVVLDVVYNHMGPEGNYLETYGPYFTDKYKTPWGNAINFDDAYCDEVRRFFIENALMWFRDFHIDALRLDAVHAIRDFSPVHILSDIKRYTDALTDATGRRHYLIVECDLNDSRFTDSTEKRGFGMDAQWIDEFHHALRVAAGNERQGYYSDFSGLVHLAKAYRDAFVYDGMYSPLRLKTFGTKATGIKGSQFVAFSQNHDQVGNRMLGERTSQLVDFEMLKLLAGAVMVSPYLPLLFMGEEWAAPQPFQYFISHTDEALVDAVRKGRKDEFAAFHSTGEAPDPQSEDTFKACKLRWELLERPLHNAMYDYYRALIKLRRSLPALHIPDRSRVAVTADEPTQVLALHRWNGAQHILCLMNFSGDQQTVSARIDGHLLTKIFDSADSRWGGPGPATAPDTDHVSLQPQSLTIYANDYV